MSELVVGKYEFYPFECPRCKEPKLEELEELLQGLKDERREGVREKAKQPQRRKHDFAQTNNLLFGGN